MNRNKLPEDQDLLLNKLSQSIPHPTTHVDQPLTQTHTQAMVALFAVSLELLKLQCLPLQRWNRPKLPILLLQ